MEIYEEGTLVYLLAPHASSLQTRTTKFRQDFIGPLVVKTRLDTTHYTLSDLIGWILPDVYQINRLKQARVMTSCGIVTSIKGLTGTETIPLSVHITRSIKQISKHGAVTNYNTSVCDFTANRHSWVILYLIDL